MFPSTAVGSGPGAGPPDALPGAGLQGADLPRAGPGHPGALPAAVSRLTAQVSAVARELAGRASARLLPALGIMVSRHTALRVLLKIPLPGLTVPRVLGIDDFALRRGLVYATVLIDAETGRRVDVIPGRTADVAEDWLREHPGAEVVCRDGSGAYGEAVRQALPRRCRSVTAGTCGTASARPSARKSRRTPPAGRRASRCRKASGPTPPERWQQVHDLRARTPACSTAPAA